MDTIHHVSGSQDIRLSENLRPPQPELLAALNDIRLNIGRIPKEKVNGSPHPTRKADDVIEAFNKAISGHNISFQCRHYCQPSLFRYEKDFKDKGGKQEYWGCVVYMEYIFTDGVSDFRFCVAGAADTKASAALDAIKQAQTAALKTLIEELFLLLNSQQNYAQSRQSDPRVEMQHSNYQQNRNEPPPNASTVQKVTPAPKAATPGKKAVEIGLVKQSNKPSKPTPPTLEVICQLLNQQFFDNDMLRESLEDFVHTKESIVWANAAMNIKLGNTPFKPNKDGGTLGAEAFESIRDQQINAEAKKEALLGVFDMVNSYNFTCPQHIQLVASLLKLKQGKQESK